MTETLASPVPADRTAERARAAEVLLSIVASKTGLDPSMLSLDMDLNADLALDSITKVEIIAALRDAIPILPNTSAKDLASVKTLGDVVAFF